VNGSIQNRGSKSLRKGRVSIPRQLYLITTATHKREALFNNKQVTDIVADALRWLHEHRRIDLVAYIIMPDHLHFIAGLLSGTLSDVMHSLKSFTAKNINKILNKEGAVWQGQYHDHAIGKEESLEDVVYYCLHNPVRKGLVDDYRKYPYWYYKWTI